jgi:hypothetical protein
LPRDIEINDATRAYLAAFDRWLRNPTISNAEERVECLQRVIGRAPAAAVALCKKCDREFTRPPGRGRPRLICERCSPPRRIAKRPGPV